MTFGRIAGSVLALCTCAPARALVIPREIDEQALLRAIAQRETGNDARKIGPMGERSRYQFTRDTWRLHSRLAFAWATDDTALADQVALVHLRYLQSVLRVHRQPQDAAHLAAAWHYGPRFAHVCLNTEYVRAVVNLYAEEVFR